MKMSIIEFLDNKLGLKMHVLSNTGWYRTCCPIHGETRPSFGVLTQHPYLVRCFSCGYKKSLVSLAAHMLQVSQVRAKEIIEENVDIKLEVDPHKKPLVAYAVSDAVQDFYEFSFPGSVAEKYTQYRGIPKWATKLWQFGYDELNAALVIPMRSTTDYKIMGHLSTQIQGSFQEVFKNKNCEQAGETVTVPNGVEGKRCVVVEGPLDAAKAAEFMWAQGIDAVPVTLNTAYPSKSQLNYIRKFEKVLLGLDHDSAGLAARKFCIDHLRDKAFLYDLVYPEARKDPGELIPGDRVGIKLIV